MDDGTGARNSRGCGLRSTDAIDRLGANARFIAGLLSFAGTGHADHRASLTPMQPRDLKSEQFKGYPPEAKKLVTDYIAVLRQLPLSFLPSLLREAIDYDYKFPPERHALERELAKL